MPTQSKIGWRPYVNPSITASSLWNSIYSVYNADAIGSSSLNTSLVAAYNGESNTNDSFGSNNGTAQGGLTYGTGKIGNAFVFNGSNSYVSLPNNSFNSLTNDFSVSFWMNLTNSHSVNGGQLFSNIQTSIGISTYFGFQIGFYNNQIYFTVGSNTGNSTASTRLISNALSGYIGTWVHVTCTHKQSTGYKIYVNGVLNNSNNGTYNPVYTTDHTPSIGAQYSIYATPNLAYKLNGSMDALSVWNKELTQSEITELYNSGNGAQYITDSFYKPTTNDALLVNNGTAQGGLTYGLGKVGTSFVFNGSNSYVSLPNNTFKFTGNFSVSLWFYCKTSSNVQTLINGYDYTGSASGGWILVVFGTGNFLDFQTYINTQATSKSRYQVDFNTGAFNNQWVHITLTRVSSTSTKIYINGTEASGSFIKGSVTDNPTYLTNCYSEIGGDFVTSGGLINPCDNGTKIDAVNVWQKELTASEITELYNSGNGKQYVSSLDSDAQAFIASAAITVTTQQTAINTLVTDLKAANIWTKMKAIYPFVGGNATAHSYNLINVANYQLMFMGGGTHTSLGYVGNGTTGYAKTSIIPNNVFTQNNIHVSYYSQTDAARAADDIGVYQAGKAPIQVYMRYGSTTSLAYLNASTGSSTVSTGRRYLVASRQSSSAVSVTNNGTTSSISSNSAAALATTEIYIHSLNFNGSASGYSNRTSSTITFGQTLTDAEAQTLSVIVNTFNTTLGRNVY